jgi:ATP-dependent DNA helicase RecG
MTAKIQKLLREGEGLMYKQKIFDRNEDGDYDVTQNTELAGLILDRKRGLSSENRIYPHITADDLLLDELMPKVRVMSTMRIADHPWKSMSDLEILKSASLCQSTKWTETTGFNLAAILLFGREEVIRSVLPGYVTDCILRRDDLDRYDDRLRVSCNLIEAFDKIVAFIAKHTLDRFYLEGALSTSPRSKIARELVSNILSHREFTSTVPAKVVIERDRIVTENWCLPKQHGKLDPRSFTPQPKNPLIANFFVNINYADTLGSGVRNLYKYTKIYTGGGEPELIEGDIFRTIIPLSLIGESDNVQTSDKTTKDKLLDYLRGNDEVTAAEAAIIIDRATPTARRLLSELVDEGLAEITGANRNRKYKIVK